MDDATASKQGPTLNASVQEVQGVFPSEAAMEAAIGELTLAGFDRAAFSMPHTSPAAAHATPEQGADTLITDTDVRQARTMGTSMAGTIGAFAAAGAVVATGGAAAVAAVAALAVGAGSALTANTVGNAADTAQASDRAEAAAAGRLVLSVHAPDTAQQVSAERIMRAAGATEIGTVERENGALRAIDSASWTG